jgi:hypothetical protein
MNCEKVTNYYWISWAGNYHDTGTTDLDKAQKIANGRPLSVPDICKN